ncbi:MAG: acyl-CoA dehydrogenase family protein, partial [Flavobacteriales bacterium]
MTSTKATPRAATDLYQAHDHYLVDELLTEEHKLIRDTTRKYVSKHIKPIIEESFEKAEFHPEIIPGLAEIGAFGPNIPTEYGGMGL